MEIDWEEDLVTQKRVRRALRSEHNLDRGRVQTQNVDPLLFQRQIAETIRQRELDKPYYGCVDILKDGKWMVPPEKRPKGWERIEIWKGN